LWPQIFSAKDASRACVVAHLSLPNGRSPATAHGADKLFQYIAGLKAFLDFSKADASHICEPRLEQNFKEVLLKEAL
jgi:hypothetical protein